MMRLVFALTLAAFASPAIAQTDQPPRPMPHGMMNADGTQTREQAMADADASFDRMDTNHDGQLTPDERAASRPMRAGASPQGAGGPGVERTFTRDQFRARAAARFDRMDINHDGKIDPAERAAFRAQQRERRADRMGEVQTGPAAQP